MITGQSLIFDGAAAIAGLFKSMFVLWLSIATFWTISVSLRKLHRNHARQLRRATPFYPRGLPLASGGPVEGLIRQKTK